MRTDTGSATVWWICLCLLLWSVTLAVAAAAVSRLDRERATTAADLAALAGAARAVRGPSEACDGARTTAEANNASLVSCELDGHTVDVTATVPSTVLDRDVSARARAGPAHEATTPEEER
ncbi:Rv3654c family TadE-like protein [Nocardiopsis kunsanensis]|uniref:Putative Flp pilus-assembly TadG-like N-terminal domain-containing protein n=1 Tax=Nocardiopsis kunsanensis TaxID=141693 RepID=A0A918XH47_9ACTN|nr:Rv3654c family TadE-like protein [Nocardiopsis kunsanensis]GHD31756.1 hypothetical protein GCM10007147_34690 [Nocardiopsis kunsanensis]